MATRLLTQVRWIGGAPGAGKTTIANTLASAFGLRVYSTDEAISRHARTGGRAVPLLDRFLGMTLEERWLGRSPEEMFATFPWFTGERFDLIIDDLQAAPAAPVTLAEGFRLLPDLVQPLLGEAWQAVWLVATERVRRAAYRGRPINQQFWRRTSNPDAALELLLRRDALFAALVNRQAEALRMKVIHVDGTRPASAVAREVAAWFRLTPTQPSPRQASL